MTRVIYFSRDYTTHDHRFLSALAKSRYEVFFLRLEKRRQQVEDRPLPAGVSQISWKGGVNQVTLFDYPGLLRDLRRVIREVKPDLIHAGPIQNCALLAALSGFKPLVSMSWGYDLLQDAGRTKVSKRATEYILRRSSILVVDCDTVKKKALELGMPAAKIISFPWGVDLDAFSPGGDSAEESDRFTLLSTRSWESIYGVDILAQGFAVAAQQNPQLRLIMLGSGSHSGYLRKLFSGAGLMDRVFLPGQVTQNDLPRYYAMADLYISASHIDGSSVSLLEALASGLPAVVSDIPGNREWVEHGVNGWWFKDGDADELAAAILNAVSQSNQLVEMGKAARQTAEQRADWDQNFPHLLDAYARALGNS